MRAVVLGTLLAAISLAAGEAAADAVEPSRFVVEPWDHAVGRSTYVRDVLQSQQGYLWVATQRGLARFDGMDVDVFDARSTANRLRGSVLAIHEGPSGALWIATEMSGLLRLEGDSLSSVGEGLPERCVRDVVERRDRSVWVAPCSGGLFRSDGASRTSFAAQPGFDGTTVNALYEDTDGRLWIGAVDGLTRIDGDEKRTFDAGDGLPFSAIHAIGATADGTVWVGTRAGLGAIQGNEASTVPGLEPQIVRSIRAGLDGSVWVGGSLGVHRFSGGAWQSFGRPHGLVSDQVFALEVTRDGTVWVGSSIGLDSIREAVFSVLGESEGLSYDDIASLFEDDDGAMWIATWGGGLNRVKGGAIETYGVEDGVPGMYVSTVFRDSRGDLWVGTGSRGLWRRSSDGASRTYTTADGLTDNAISAIAEDRSGTLWVGSGKHLHRLAGDAFEMVPLSDPPVPSWVHTIVEDAEGALWVGRRNGLVRLRDGSAETFTADDGLPGDAVLAVHGDRDDGTLWIATSPGGLTRFRDGAFFSVTPAEGLCHETVQWILEDDRGRFWMSSDVGVFVVDKNDVDAFADGEASTVPCVLYGQSAGMRTDVCNGGYQMGGVRARDGRMWFPTPAGVVSLDPTDTLQPARPPPVVLKQALADRRVLDVANEQRVARGDGELEFHFAAIAFVDPRSVQYRYRLEGFDDAWREVGPQRVARFTNLPAGRYRFQVSARHGTSDWSEPHTGLAVELLPRFYETRAFFLTVALGLAALVLGTYWVRSRQIRTREARLARLVDERTRELSEATRLLEEANRRQSEFVSGVSHELKTPLTLIHLYAETLLAEPEASAEDRESHCRVIARESMRLSQLVDRVLALGRYGSPEWRRELVPGDLAGIVASALETYRDHLDRRGFVVEQELADSCPEVSRDPDAVATAVISLIDNAVKYSEDERFIAIRVYPVDESVVVEVEDRGRGVPPSEFETIFRKFQRGSPPRGVGGYGIGLYLVRQVMLAHGGSIEFESEVGRGSTFRLVFPARATEKHDAEEGDARRPA